MPTTAAAANGVPPSASPNATPITATTAETMILQFAQHWLERPVPEDEPGSELGDEVASSTASLASSIMHYREVNGRTYHSDSVGDHYWGANDDQQNKTLDIGHHGFTLLLDGKLFLSPLPEHIDKALDIGTGTGIWATDFAEERPDTIVIGTDISPIQPAWVPPNVCFQIEDFTQSWTFVDNSVDYIHSRWICGSITDWDAFYREAFRVLKPGGWVESFDFDAAIYSQSPRLSEASAAVEWAKILVEGARRMGSRASFYVVSEDLQRKAIEAAGFGAIAEKAYQLPMSEWPADETLKEVGLFWRAATCNDAEGMIQLMATQLGWTAEQIGVFCGHFRQELRLLRNQPYCKGKIVYAQKPF